MTLLLIETILRPAEAEWRKAPRSSGIWKCLSFYAARHGKLKKARKRVEISPNYFRSPVYDRRERRRERYRQNQSEKWITAGHDIRERTEQWFRLHNYEDYQIPYSKTSLKIIIPKFNSYRHIPLPLSNLEKYQYSCKTTASRYCSHN